MSLFNRDIYKNNYTLSEALSTLHNTTWQQDFLLYGKIYVGYSENTLASYQNDLNLFNLCRSIDELENLLLDRSSAAPNTLARRIATLHSYSKYLFNTAHTAIDLFQTQNLALKKTRALRRIEAYQTLLEACDYYSRDSIPYLALRLLLHTGLRASEWCQLKNTDFDRTQNTLKICGKGQKERLVPVPTQIQASLKRFINNHKYNTFYIFHRPNNPRQALTRRTLWNWVHEAGNFNGLKLSPHSFRHAYATYLLKKGVHLKAIQALLGHTSLMTTQQYLHYQTDDLRAALNMHHPLASIAS